LNAGTTLPLLYKWFKEGIQNVIHTMLQEFVLSLHALDNTSFTASSGSGVMPLQ
jgi:hypothetical protein